MWDATSGTLIACYQCEYNSKLMCRQRCFYLS